MPPKLEHDQAMTSTENWNCEPEAWTVEHALPPMVENQILFLHLFITSIYFCPWLRTKFCFYICSLQACSSAHGREPKSVAYLCIASMHFPMPPLVRKPFCRNPCRLCSPPFSFTQLLFVGPTAILLAYRSFQIPSVWKLSDLSLLWTAFGSA
jgi:hypothetical protein